jgi:hypothetical protein
MTTRWFRGRWLVVLVTLLATPARADDSWWIHPLDRALVRLSLVHEDDRPYSTPAHPRDIVGVVGVACEHQAEWPCGEDASLDTALEASAGYGDHARAAARVRYSTWDGLGIDRLYVAGHVGPVSAKVGRDVLVLGPASRTQLGWGDNAPPLDMARVDARIGPLSGTYVLGRLRDPQTYPGDLVSIARGQIDLGAIQLGAMQLLQLGGDGAPGFGFSDFILEHFRRRDASAGASDSSNRRLGVDVSWRIAGFGGARLYYELVFEDWRKQFEDALRYDADHAVGWETRWVLVEWQKTGVRSQEHRPRVTGLTNDGRAVGSPLGPDAQAVYAGARRGLVRPWAEVVRFGSDDYMFVVDGPIVHESRGVAEWRYRLGAQSEVQLDRHDGLGVQAWVEHVENVAFVRGMRRENLGVLATFVWTP